jgi:hypothetical protein
MDNHLKERYVTNIISGVVVCNIKDQTYIINEASLFDKSVAEQIYADRLREAELRGVMSNDELITRLSEIGMWTKNDQAELDTLPKRMENFKVQLYQAYHKYKGREPIRKQLNNLKTKFTRLTIKRETLKRESSEGVATVAKNKYLICSNVVNIHGHRIWSTEDYWKQDSRLIEALVREYMESRLEETVIRELARTEPWRTTWGVAKSEKSLFGIPATMLTTEQKSLVVWSRIYDSVYESTECPPETVILDDDMLDGWLILQSREREEERKKAHGFTGKKGPSGQEVFLFADGAEDAERIQAMNDPHGKSVLRQRMQALQKAGGRLSEEKMPDAQQAMRQQAMQQMKQHLQRGK